MGTLSQCLVTAWWAFHPADHWEGTALAGLVLVDSARLLAMGLRGISGGGDFSSDLGPHA